MRLAFTMAEGAPEGKRIVLIPMDGSEHAEHAFDCYIKQIRMEKDFVIVVYVERPLILPPNQATPIGRETLSRDVKQNEADIIKLVHNLKKLLMEHNVDGKVKHVNVGEPGEGILKAADDHHADMIIVGSRGMGRHSILGIIPCTTLGSVSNYVVHNSKIPVIVCKDTHH